MPYGGLCPNVGRRYQPKASAARYLRPCDSDALRTDSLGGGDAGRIDYPVTSPAGFLKVVTRSCGDFRERNDSKMTASTR
jgi:hypothetical protein